MSTIPQWQQNAAAGRNEAALVRGPGFSDFLFTADAHKAVHDGDAGAKLLEERVAYSRIESQCSAATLQIMNMRLL